MMNQNIIPAEKRNNKELCTCPQHEEFANADFNVSSPSVDDNAFLSSNTTILSEANNLTKNEGTSKNENDVTNTDECGNETWDKQLITGIINLKLQCQKLQQQHIEFEKRLNEIECKQIQSADNSSSEDNDSTIGADSVSEDLINIDTTNIDNRTMRLVKDLLRLIHATCKHYKNVTTFEETSFRNLLENYGILRTVIERYLKEYDITLIDPEEKMEFDHDLHNCVDLVSTTQEDEHGTIHTCVSLGYYNSKTDMVLTPAEVAVLEYKSEE